MLENSKLEELFQRAQKARQNQELMEKAVTGAAVITNEPESLFYTHFSRDDAEAFYQIFTNFRTYYEENPAYAPETLLNQLDQQCEHMEDMRIRPVDILLFSARYISDILRDDIMNERFDSSDTAGVVVQVLQKHLPGCNKSVSYILGGWEWPYLIYVLLRACGICGDAPIIKTALERSAQVISRLVSEEDITVLMGYVDMLSLRQDDKLLPELVELYTMEQIKRNSTAKNYLMEKIGRDPYFRTKQQQLFDLLKDAKISEALYNDIIYQERKLSRVSESNPLKSNLSHAKKADYIENIDLASDGYQFLQNVKDCSDKNLLSKICIKLCEDFDLLPAHLHPQALIRIGSSGHESYNFEQCKNIAFPLLHEQIQKCNEHPELTVPILIALYEYEIIEQEEQLFQEMDKVSLDNQKDRAVMAYFRWRYKPLFAINYFSHVETMLNEELPMKDMLLLLNNMYQLCKGFDDRSKNLGKRGNTPDAPIISNILRIVNRSFSVGFEKDLYSVLVSLLELVKDSCRDRKKEIPPILDEPYKIVPRDGTNFRLLTRMENLIKECDPVGAPTDT